MNISPLAFTDEGAGPVLVFLHGFCESKALWSDFLPPLAARFRVIALDLPGHGESPVPDTFTMSQQAQKVKETLESLNLDKDKFLLVGHSMGGYVALAFAEKFGAQLQGLCLFHSSALPDTEEKKESRNKTMEFVQKHGVTTFMDSFVAPLFGPAHRDACQPQIRKMQEIGKETPTETIIGCLTAMRDRPARTHVLKEAPFPILFIAGKEDGAVPLESTLQQCHLPQHSMTYFLGDVGHMGMLEQPPATRQALQKFAESVFGL